MIMNSIEVTIQSLRVNPIHNKWELHFKDNADHYLPVFLEEHQVSLIGREMRRPGSVEPADVAIAGIDLKVYELESVIVNDLKGEILNTKLTLKHNNKHLKVDYPSEKAIVLALREGAPILMEEEYRSSKANKS